MTKEALKLALEALETLMIERGSIYDKAITAIKEALANEALEKMAENARELGLDYEPEQTEQHQDWCASLTQMLMSMPPKPAPCNCKPPQRTWTGLTDEDFLEACQIAERGNYLVAFQRIQAKLKEKNT
jgi:hypothetical protein